VLEQDRKAAGRHHEEAEERPFHRVFLPVAGRGHFFGGLRAEQVHLDRAIGRHDGRQLLHARQPPIGPAGTDLVALAVEPSIFARMRSVRTSR